jgi:group I intron endonuclease
MTSIYKIQSICKPDRIYIGSAVKTSRRWTKHLYQLRHGLHNSKIQRHYDKYGESDLHFSIIISDCKIEDLLFLEQIFIDRMNPYFNASPKSGSQNFV